MIVEQCEGCEFFRIEFNKIMGLHYALCTNSHCVNAWNNNPRRRALGAFADEGIKIEYIKKCPMGKYDPVGPVKETITSALDYAFQKR